MGAFPPVTASMFVKFKGNLSKSFIEIFWDEVFYQVRNTAKNGHRKRSAFDMQFHLIVISIFFKTSVKDHGDSSSGLLERGV